MKPSALDSNRTNWDMLVPIHKSSRFYDVNAFIDGRSTLHPLEVSLVGSCHGKDLLHLQCHFGLDSLSWARLGATVTGVDFSPVAIEAAQCLSLKTGVSAQFYCVDVQRLSFNTQFDVAVTTYGVLCWIESLQAWAEGIHRALRPGGLFVLVDFHPFLEAIHPGKMTGAKSYFGNVAPSVVSTLGTYADRSAQVEYQEFRWQHPTSKIVSSLIDAGFELIRFDEYPYCTFGLFDELEQIQLGVWEPKKPAVWPYMFSIQVRKRG